MPGEAGSGSGSDGSGSGSDGSVTGPRPREKPITIDKNQVTGNVTMFPVWVDITDAQVMAGAQQSGSDLYFTDDTGAAVPYEITHWDPNTGRLQAWVRLPSVTHSSGAKFYLRYGDTSAVPPPSPAMVFGAYAAVWHFDDSLATTTAADALGQTPATAMGMDATRSVAGTLGGAFDFDGNSMQVQFTNMLLGGTPHTISAWVSQRTPRNFDALVVVGTNNLNQSRWFYTAFNQPNLAVGLYSNDFQSSATASSLEGQGWTLVHWVFDGHHANTLYVNGTSIGNFNFTAGDAATAGNGGWIGYAPNTPSGGWGADDWLNGQIDEVRIATTQLPANWIATEYANQKSPSTFYTVGQEQPVP